MALGKIIGTSALVLAMALGGCASNVSTPESLRASGGAAGSGKASATDFETVKSEVTFEHDRHLGARTATGPEIRYLDPDRNKWLDGYAIYKILAFDVGRSGPDVVDFSDVQIRVRQATYGDWPQYNAAYSEGEQFELTRTDGDVNCLGAGSCMKTEIVGIDMTMDELRSLAERDILAFKVIGKRNSMVIQIPQSYVQGFLAAVADQEGNAQPAAAAN